MGLFDKVKSQAMDLKGKVEDKVEDVQAKKKADDLLDDLGRLLYAERTDRPVPNAEARDQPHRRRAEEPRRRGRRHLADLVVAAVSATLGR